MIETVELVCKRIHMPYPNVRIRANQRVAIGPPELAEALCRRGFFEKVAPEIIKQEAEAEKPAPEPKKEKERKGGK